MLGCVLGILVKGEFWTNNSSLHHLSRVNERAEELDKEILFLF